MTFWICWTLIVTGSNSGSPLLLVQRSKSSPSSGEIYEKPVALLNASMSATRAQASLTETLTTADAYVVWEASVRVGLPSNRIGEAGIVSDPKLSEALRSAMVAFARAIEARRAR